MTTFPHRSRPHSRASVSVGATDQFDCTKIAFCEDAHLRLLSTADAPELHALIMSNREHLAQWLAWAAAQTFQDTLEFIRRSERQVAANEGFHAAIVCQDRIAGVISYMEVDWRHRRTVLGYWLDADHQGRGLMTSAVRLMVDHAITVWDLNRVEIRAAVENGKSRAIPERLGFDQEGVLHQAELVSGRYLDSIVYAMLAANWSERSTEAGGDARYYQD
ncbi:MAG TPA: GNAT family protein [Solirubrobacteraceae bacterium]|nr:GNAT family protein [Solirubrobacteraceae bacterium]